MAATPAVAQSSQAPNTDSVHEASAATSAPADPSSIRRPPSPSGSLWSRADTLATIMSTQPWRNVKDVNLIHARRVDAPKRWAGWNKWQLAYARVLDYDERIIIHLQPVVGTDVQGDKRPVSVLLEVASEELARGKSRIWKGLMPSVGHVSTDAYAQAFYPTGPGTYSIEEVEVNPSSWRFASVGLSTSLDNRALAFAREVMDRLDPQQLVDAKPGEFSS